MMSRAGVETHKYAVMINQSDMEFLVSHRVCIAASMAMSALSGPLSVRGWKTSISVSSVGQRCACDECVLMTHRTGSLSLCMLGFGQSQSPVLCVPGDL